MSIAVSLLPELDHEMAGTRSTLERLPADKLGWKPHPKSFSMGDLATHLVELPGWAVATLKLDQLDIAPVGGPAFQRVTVISAAEALEKFDKSLAEARGLLASASDEHMMGNWSLLMGGRTIMTMPRVAVLRSFVLNHNVHHRAQLGVYYRMNDVPVPALYGPSADEGSMGMG